ncbi:hypothetical protein FisN_24Hh027 [Fistulifera solaris]|uniref:Uncharacterized protein n=1 Tax=Fistulifera solaris TaxID=1519565 RepID=A0A1Z5JEM1_FISSO|nr:hypothetical protein FisN_24Hh027 [Fistulifera solaris]|eukprot:GAX12453.1 hypothetical protein FisN_24Hh027 [Fistulifera solaris]
MCFRLLDFVLPLWRQVTRKQAFDSMNDDADFLVQVRESAIDQLNDGEVPPLIVPFDDPDDPLNLLSPLEYAVYTSQWQVFWGYVLMEKWDTSVHPRPLKSSIRLLCFLLDRDNEEMIATLYLANVLLNQQETINMKEIQECLAILDPLFEWKKEVLRTLHLKRMLLESMDLPEGVQETIWREHVHLDVIRSAIAKCARGVVAALDDELSQRAVKCY